jgi:hypothetical protein
MKKFLIILYFLTGLFGCNSHLDKSIFTPLTVEELKKSIDKDSTFESTYKYIQFVKDSILRTELDRVKFADITYERLNDFIIFSNDTNYFNPIDERLRKEWQNKYGKYQSKVDSISQFWKKYKAENSLEQYVKVDLVQIDKDYYSYSNGIKNIYLGFRLTPLKGKVDQIRFGYRIEAKINETEKSSVYESIYSSLDKSWCLATTPFSTPIVRLWEASYTNEKVLESKTIETFNRDYNIYIEVDEIRKDGKNMSNDDLNIPKSVTHHWEYEKKEYLQDLYVKDIIKDLLHEDYLEEYEYRYQEFDKILKAKDPLCFEFIRLKSNTK